MPKLSVIICTYNREDYIEQALNSLADQSLASEQFEIVLINNNSTDKTGELCKKFIAKHKDCLQIQYHIEFQQGLSYARNRGIRESKGELLVFMDDDAFASPDYLAQTLRFFDEHPQVLAGGGRIYPRWESQCPVWMSKYLMPLVSVIDWGNDIKYFSGKHFPIGANMMMRRKAFEQYGDFNTRLGRTGKMMLGGEEKDFFFRLYNANEQVAYLPAALVEHLVPDRRLKTAFIKKQALGIGLSERLRAAGSGTSAYVKIYLYELMKWAATLLLATAYLLQAQYRKSSMLVRFRFWVSKGMLTKTKPTT